MTVEQAEDELRHEVEILWKRFREGVDKVEQDRIQTLSQHSSRDTDNSTVSNKGGSTAGQKAPVAVRDFVPVVSRSAKTTSATYTPRMSSLSASLATSSFHHPKAQQEQISSHSPKVTPEKHSRPEPSSPDSSSLGSSASRTLSSQSDLSSLSTSPRLKVEGSVLPEPFKRSMDPAQDTAVSFQYFTILEADMVRTRERGKAAEERQNPPPERSNSKRASRGRSEVVKSIANGNKENNKTDSGPEHSTTANQSLESEVVEGSPGRKDELKGKRKVTFDVQQDVAPIKNDADANEKGATTIETGGKTPLRRL